MIRSFIFGCVAFLHVAVAGQPPLLSLSEVRPTMKEMFGYHVENKRFSPMIARRSARLFLEQFDPYHNYLLKKEVTPFLFIQDDVVSAMIHDYHQGKFSFYEKMNDQIIQAIQRQRAFRQQATAELIGQAYDITTLPLVEKSSGHQATVAELKKAVYFELLGQVQRVVERRGIQRPTPEIVRKILAHYEKKALQWEENYVAQKEPLATHFFTLHLLKAFAKSLDAHSGYYSPAEAYRIRVSLQKQFSGIGIVLQEDFDAIYIAKLIPKGPAEKSGRIQVGDQLVAINHENIEGLAFDVILDRLKGEMGSLLVLGLKNSGGDLTHVELVRKQIVMEDQRLSLDYEIVNNGVIGKITLPAFYDNGHKISAEHDLRAALQELRKKGPLLGLVIDLRENAGGFLRQAIKVSELFIQSGVIVVSKYAGGEVSYAVNRSGKKIYDGPLVLLTSKASASAAEIVAQTLQDHGVALVVGDKRSYGKGSMQHQTITDPRARSFFKVTVGRYYTASGRSPQIQGVEADIFVPTRYFPYRIGERYLAFPLANDHLSRDLFQALRKVRQGKEGKSFEHLIVPYLQPRPSQWRKMLPQLVLSSQQRLMGSQEFQEFLAKGKLAQKGEKPNSLVAPFSHAKDGHPSKDLQLQEAVMIVKDMVALTPKFSRGLREEKARIRF